MLIWDSCEKPKDFSQPVLLWSSYNNDNYTNTISIIEFINNNKKNIRDIFLQWVHELSNKKIQNKNLINYFKLNDNFSYWWLTLIAHKANAFDSKYILEITKLISFSRICENIHDIHLVTSDKKLIITFKEYCQKNKLNFTYELLQSKNHNKIKLLNKLPYYIQALLYAIKYFFQFKIKIFPKSNILINNVTFFDAFVHLNNNAIPSKKFISNYWTELPNLLQKKNIKTNWVHNFYKSNQIPNFTFSKKVVKDFNYTEKNKNFHLIVEDNLTLKIFLITMLNYVIIYFKALYANLKINNLFQDNVTGFNFWYYYEDDWNKSFFGKHLFNSLLQFNNYQSLLSRMPFQNIGFYILENQPWEYSLINAWRSNKHGILVGIPHTTIRFWDLRYFNYQESFKRQNLLPIPDFIGVNSHFAYNSLLESGYSKSSLIKLEALRYLHILNKNKFKETLNNKNSIFTILLCGDILHSTNKKLINLVEAASKHFNKNYKVIVKYHPGMPIKKSDFTIQNIKITNEPLQNIFSEVDLVLTSNISSSAVDAFCYGKNVASILDNNSFNFSPLENEIIFISKAEELIYLFNNLNSKKKNYFTKKDYFYLDNNLTLWNSFLNEIISSYEN
jgi:surface carbohydrate biosynthesis protein (TIGR04326 family)